MRIDLSLQEIFNRVCRGMDYVHATGQAFSEFDLCCSYKYHSFLGNNQTTFGCAIGALIPNYEGSNGALCELEIIDDDMVVDKRERHRERADEDGSAYDDVAVSLIDEGIDVDDPVVFSLLCQAQSVNDNHPPRDWYDELSRIAGEFPVKLPELVSIAMDVGRRSKARSA